MSRYKVVICFDKQAIRKGKNNISIRSCYGVCYDITFPIQCVDKINATSSELLLLILYGKIAVDYVRQSRFKMT